MLLDVMFFSSSARVQHYMKMSAHTFKFAMKHI